MYNLTSFFVLLIPFYLATITADDTKLVQLNVLFRHGDRTPETFPKRFPNDPNMRSSFHPMGPGGLTNEGKMRMYHLGEVLRNKYSEFLGQDYDPDRLFAISSDFPRTQMSLMLVLASLYPPHPTSRDRWHTDLNWQPIPFKYNEVQKDYIFSRNRCKEFINEYNKVFNSTEVQAEMRKIQPYLDELKNHTGKASPITLLDVLMLHLNLDIEKKLNLPMEPWMLEAMADERLNKTRILHHRVNTWTPKLRRLRGGYLLRRINEDMLEASNRTLGYENKISLYSGHDKNIIELLASLGVYDFHFPEFGCAVIIELLSQNNKYYVKIAYYKGIPDETNYLKIPGCDTLCPLEKYMELTNSSQALDHEIKCTIV